MYPDKIIMHHSLTKDTKTVSWGAIRKYHLNKGWEDIGYHFGIELVGTKHEIFVGRLMNVPGAHTKGQNSSSIGICLIGNFDKNKPPKEQWDLAVKLVSSLCEILYLTSSSIYGHNNYASYKSCPGELFSMDRFRNAVDKERN